MCLHDVESDELTLKLFFFTIGFIEVKHHLYQVINLTAVICFGASSQKSMVYLSCEEEKQRNF